MRLRTLLSIVSIIIVCGSWALHQQSTTALQPSRTNLVASAGAATSTSDTNNAKAGAANLYPDPALTPGAVLTTDAATVCAPGYATSVRNVPVAEKREVYAEYHLAYPQPAGSYEADHFISLELGGSNDITNLWPEPALPRPGFHEKDVVENYLHDQVCSGKLSLPDAQKEISTDWYAVYVRIGV